MIVPNAHIKISFTVEPVILNAGCTIESHGNFYQKNPKKQKTKKPQTEQSSVCLHPVLFLNPGKLKSLAVRIKHYHFWKLPG